MREKMLFHTGFMTAFSLDPSNISEQMQRFMPEVFDGSKLDRPSFHSPLS